MPSPTHRLSIAVFLSVAGYSPFRTIKASSRATVLQLFVDNGLNPPTYTSPTNLFSATTIAKYADRPYSIPKVW